MSFKDLVLEACKPFPHPRHLLLPFSCCQDTRDVFLDTGAHVRFTLVAFLSLSHRNMKELNREDRYC